MENTSHIDAGPLASVLFRHIEEYYDKKGKGNEENSNEEESAKEKREMNTNGTTT